MSLEKLLEWAHLGKLKVSIPSTSLVIFLKNNSVNCFS